MSDFFDMGRYAVFVWSAYGLTALGIGAAIAVTMRAYHRAKEHLASLEVRQVR